MTAFLSAYGVLPLCLGRRCALFVGSRCASRLGSLGDGRGAATNGRTAEQRGGSENYPENWWWFRPGRSSRGSVPAKARTLGRFRRRAGRHGSIQGDA
jgi:hypothetical protein